MRQHSAHQNRRQLIGLCHAGLDSRALRTELIKRLRTVIPIDLACFGTTDPVTLLLTGTVVDEQLTRAIPQLIANEYLQGDVNKLDWMVRSKTPVVSLMQATEGKLERSQRYREILAPLALGDELRAALIAGGALWGFLCMHRERSSPPFTLTEATYLARLAPHFAEGLRTALLLGGMARSAAPDEPGLLLLAEDFSVAATTPAGERWLAEIGETDWPRRGALPYAIAAVVGRLQSSERGDEALPDLLPRVRVRTASGHWLVVHASRLSGRQAQGRIAVIFEVARPAEVAPLLVQAYAFSKREGEILQGVVRGLSTTEMAEAFHISSHTIQDHLKAIFEKVGVRSRRALVGQLFAQHYQPRIAAGRGLGQHGGFT